MKALRLTVLSALLVILLVAPGYAGTNYYGSGGGYGHVSSHALSHDGYHVPIHDGYYHHAYREGTEVTGALIVTGRMSMTVVTTVTIGHTTPARMPTSHHYPDFQSIWGFRSNHPGPPQRWGGEGKKSALAGMNLKR